MKNDTEEQFKRIARAISSKPKKRFKYKFRTEREVLEAAAGIIEGNLRATGQALTSPELTRDFLLAQLGWRENETFVVMFLDNQYRLIESVNMFSGTIDQAGVYPREVVKAALERNAAAVTLAHNHPSGEAEPSRHSNNKKAQGCS